MDTVTTQHLTIIIIIIVVIMLSSWLRAIARVHPLQLTAANPPTRSNNLGCESTSRLLPSTSTIPFVTITHLKAECNLYCVHSVTF